MFSNKIKLNKSVKINSKKDRQKLYMSRTQQEESLKKTSR